jgi:hypothetical protein
MAKRDYGDNDKCEECGCLMDINESVQDDFYGYHFCSSECEDVFFESTFCRSNN